MQVLCLVFIFKKYIKQQIKKNFKNFQFSVFHCLCLDFQFQFWPGILILLHLQQHIIALTYHCCHIRRCFLIIFTPVENTSSLLHCVNISWWMDQQKWSKMTQWSCYINVNKRMNNFFPLKLPQGFVLTRTMWSTWYCRISDERFTSQQRRDKWLQNKWAAVNQVHHWNGIKIPNYKDKSWTTGATPRDSDICH